MTEKALTIASTDAERILTHAIEKNVSIDTLERLLAMRDKMRAEVAKQDFDSAMAKFQAACPVIVKSKVVSDKSGNPRYRYAPLDVIVQQIKEHLNNHGFSYAITSEIIPGTETSEKRIDWVSATCKVNHISGHSESSTFKVPIDPTAYMNEQQKVASALTYAKRYAFCNAFGILTGDEDDDSHAAGETSKEETAPVNEDGSAIQIPNPPADFPKDNTLVGKVKSITSKETKKKGTFRFCVKIGNRDFFTFDTKVKELAEESQKKNEYVALHFEKGGYGNDIKNLAILTSNQEEEEVPF